MLAGLQNVTFEFGARILVEDATWHIQSNERIGLIGYNGTGKSTILKLLAGEYLPSKGTIERSRETSIGYLHQDLLSFDTNDSILKVALGAFEKVLQLEKEIEELGRAARKSSPFRERFRGSYYMNMPINFTNLKHWEDIQFIIKRKRCCRDLDLQTAIFSDHIMNSAVDGE